MSEIYVAVSDALRRSPVPTWAVKMDRTPDLPRPSYLPAQEQTPAQYGAALGKLGRLGIVRSR